ncbi:MAG: (2Fe-2S)-binding protein [Armatimonadota bacterium]|nr:(2Fe-2S)-binding protein [Armatimonadota bacterium]MDR7536366.1 (2Fe-2S)-binding protein [Armatimonadota bacterium]
MRRTRKTAPRAVRRRLQPVAQAEVRVRINGTEVVRTVEVRRTLADFIREDAGLTGTHLGCEHGVCGACTVLLDGEPVRSCLLFAVQADGHEITTVEALGTPEHLSPLQQAFRDYHALQCGFCTPGFLMSAHALLRDNPHASDEEILEVLAGHLCRCTGYTTIFDAVRAAAGRPPGPPPAEPWPAPAESGPALAGPTTALGGSGPPHGE